MSAHSSHRPGGAAGAKAPLVPRPPLDFLRADFGAASEGTAAASDGRAQSGFRAAGTSESSRVGAAAAPTQRAPKTRQEIFDEAELATPFEFDEREYHTSQQNAMNAELRESVTASQTDVMKAVTAFVKSARAMRDQQPTYSLVSTSASNRYWRGYRCTEPLTRTAEQLCEEYELQLPVDEIQETLNYRTSANLSASSIARTLQTLRSSSYVLAPLERYAEQLNTLNKRYQIDVSTSAVALHEKLHYNPAQFALRELKKTDDAIQQLDKKVLDAKSRKEEAIDGGDVAVALEALTTQVDLSSDLLKLNLARLKLVELHTGDVNNMKTSIDDLLAAVNEITQALSEKCAAQKERVAHDIEALKDGQRVASRHLESLGEAVSQQAEAAREKFTQLDNKERVLWEQLCEIATKLEQVAAEKRTHVLDGLSAHEKLIREQTVANELISAQDKHLNTLRSYQHEVDEAVKASDDFHRYVEQMEEKLRAKADTAEAGAQRMRHEEVANYVQRYEIFAFASEEARAKRQSHIDLLELRKRATFADIAASPDALDPFQKEYHLKLDEVQSLLTNAKAYTDYVEQLQTDRRAEVDPYFLQVAAEIEAAARKRGRESVGDSGVMDGMEDSASGWVSAQQSGDGLSIAAGAAAAAARAAQVQGGQQEQHVAVAEEGWRKPRGSMGAPSAMSTMESAFGMTNSTGYTTAMDTRDTVGSDIGVVVQPQRSSTDGDWVVHPDDLVADGNNVEDAAEDDEMDFEHPHLAARALGLTHEENIQDHVKFYVRDQWISVDYKVSQLSREKVATESEEKWSAMRSKRNNESAAPIESSPAAAAASSESRMRTLLQALIPEVADAEL